MGCAALLIPSGMGRFGGGVDSQPAVRRTRLPGVPQYFQQGHLQARGVRPDIFDLVGAINFENRITFEIRLDGGAQGAEKLPHIDFAPDQRGRAGQRIHAVDQLGSGAGAFLDAVQAVQGGSIELFVIQEEAKIAVKKAQDIIHLMRQTPHQLILKIRMFDLHSCLFGE